MRHVCLYFSGAIGEEDCKYPSCEVPRHLGFDPDFVTYDLMVNSSSEHAGITLSDVVTIHVQRYGKDIKQNFFFFLSCSFLFNNVKV